MRYYASGESRESYVTGVRPGGRYGAMHDVEKRRDNLPENVFHYIKEGVQREERLRQNEEEARARIHLEMFARKPGQRRGSVCAVDTESGSVAEQSAAMSQLERETQTRERRAALQELYRRDREDWEAQLGARGLATRRS
ncbi:hypothetical protein LSCM1_08054 [Leishmania martiniquensis]|uniref:Uncharacterized protein n=1 Tax=Leishmania martiniquensis TaxID=1580590 RepID=A0A836I0B3_9TRYP|nr:hypothetical protein LSCM1_08054 [Leishmania martiniquensis]